MKNALLLALLCCAAFTAHAQSGFAKFIVGLEAGFDFNQLEAGEKARLIPAVQVEVPFGPVAVGAGFGRKFYHAYDYYAYTGNTIERQENGQAVTYFLSDVHSFKPAYWTVPFKAEVRVHRCQCVFVHAGGSLDFLDKKTPETIKFRNAESKEFPSGVLTHEQLFRARTHSFTLGVGFNLYANDYFRLTARPAFVWSVNPEIYTDAPYWRHTFRMTFGFQYAVLSENR